MVCNDTRHHHQKWHQYFKKAGKQYALLPFGQILGTQGSLNYILIRAPIKQVCEHHAGKQCRKRRRVDRRANRIQFFCVGGNDDRHAPQDAALPQRGKSQQRYRCTNEQQSNTVQGI